MAVRPLISGWCAGGVWRESATGGSINGGTPIKVGEGAMAISPIRTGIEGSPCTIEVCSGRHSKGVFNVTGTTMPVALFPPPAAGTIAALGAVAVFSEVQLLFAKIRSSDRAAAGTDTPERSNFRAVYCTSRLVNCCWEESIRMQGRCSLHSKKESSSSLELWVKS